MVRRAKVDKPMVCLDIKSSSVHKGRSRFQGSLGDDIYWVG